MKKIIITLILCTLGMGAWAQSASWLWPVEGAAPGTGIVSTPQSYIDNDLNIEFLFVTAPEGTMVVAPTDGVIATLGIGYNTSVQGWLSWGMPLSTFDESLAHVKADLNRAYNPRFLHGTIGLRTNDGRMLYIGGLTGDIPFQTGQRITRGTPIGRVGYIYEKIGEPSISISVSKNSRQDDPMTPFGLKTTFVPPEEVKPIVSLSKEQAKTDFQVYIDALKELYPGLRNLAAPDEVDTYAAQTAARIDAYPGDIPFGDFWQMMRDANVKFHDSHISLHEPARLDNSASRYMPKLFFGWIGDKLICTNAAEEYGHLIGQPIARVNGVPADSIRNLIAEKISGYDADVQSFTEFVLATTGFLGFLEPPYDMVVEMTDGQRLDLKGENLAINRRRSVRWNAFSMINRHNDRYALRMLNDSTAYIGISTFDLYESAMDDIARFIDSIAGTKHLIIDVRNNPGGNTEVLSKLYSYIAGDTLRLDGYSRVNKQGAYDMLRYSLNYPADAEIFSDFAAEEGKEGFYRHSGSVVRPDSAINYTGRVYVLTHENSVSAASYFAALTVRNHRGVVVGRETRTAYHFMNALKFADIRLPNSLLVITDTAGRGRFRHGGERPGALRTRRAARLRGADLAGRTDL